MGSGPLGLGEEGLGVWTPGSEGEGLRVWILGLGEAGLGVWTPGSAGGEVWGLDSRV